MKKLKTFFLVIARCFGYRQMATVPLAGKETMDYAKARHIGEMGKISGKSNMAIIRKVWYNCKNWQNRVMLLPKLTMAQNVWMPKIMKRHTNGSKRQQIRKWEWRMDNWHIPVARAWG